MNDVRASVCRVSPSGQRPGMKSFYLLEEPRKTRELTNRTLEPGHNSGRRDGEVGRELEGVNNFGDSVLQVITSVLHQERIAPDLLCLPKQIGHLKICRLVDQSTIRNSGDSPRNSLSVTLVSVRFCGHDGCRRI